MKGLQKKTLSKSILLIGILLMLLTPVTMYFSHDPAVLKDQYPHLAVQKDESLEITIKPGRPKSWASLQNISSHVKWAIIISEDWGFYDHKGVDVEQMKVALTEMVEDSRFRGASTITQQMVKNVFLSGYPTVWRKFHEIILAQKAEDTLSKKQILEVYLNCIEYGPGIYGIKAASRHYFQKDPSSLSPRESAFIAMLLPSPKKYYVSFKNRRLTKFAQKRIAAILRKLKMAKILSPEDYELELQQRFFWEKYEAPLEVVPSEGDSSEEDIPEEAPAEETPIEEDPSVEPEPEAQAEPAGP